MSDAETPVPGCLAFAVPCPSWSFSVGSAMSRGAERIAMDLWLFPIEGVGPPAGRAGVVGASLRG